MFILNKFNLQQTKWNVGFEKKGGGGRDDVESLATSSSCELLICSSREEEKTLAVTKWRGGRGDLRKYENDLWARNKRQCEVCFSLPLFFFSRTVEQDVPVFLAWVFRFQSRSARSLNSLLFAKIHLWIFTRVVFLINCLVLFFFSL